MRRAVIVARDRSSHQHSWASAFAEGLRRHGWEARISNDYDRADLIVLWGVRREDRIASAKSDGAEVCILERGYLGDRFHWTSVSFGGGLNGRGAFRGPLDDQSRWQKHFAGLMQPWRGFRGGPALLLGQVPGDMSVQGVDLPGFYRRAAAALRTAGFAVRFRAHPKAGRVRVPEVETAPAGEPIAAALKGSAMAVTFNSNSAVDAVLAGVPTVTMDKGAMAWPVTGHEFKFPPMPDRSAWAHALAWKQWTLEEMASGDCWAAVGLP